MIVAIIIGILCPFYSFWPAHLGFPILGNSATTQLPECFSTWIISWNIGLNILPADSFMSCLNALLGYCIAEFQALQLHYNDVIMSMMASQITSLAIVYSAFTQAQIKENIKASRHWPLWGEFTGHRLIPRTKGQLRGKCFHLMTSSWIALAGLVLPPVCWSNTFDIVEKNFFIDLFMILYMCIYIFLNVSQYGNTLFLSLYLHM